MVGSDSLLTGQSGSPLVENDVGNDSFGLLSGFGVAGPFTFLQQKNKPKKKEMIIFGRQDSIVLLYSGCLGYMAHLNFPTGQQVMKQFQICIKSINHTHLSEYREELPGNITPFILFTLDAPFFL